jgi:hypothetical protein
MMMMIMIIIIIIIIIIMLFAPGLLNDGLLDKQCVRSRNHTTAPAPTTHHTSTPAQHQPENATVNTDNSTISETKKKPPPKEE